jgi:hypothetical protein
MATASIVMLDRLGAFVATLPQSGHILSFFVDSPGGNIVEAEKIAAFINKTGTTVTIPSGSQCASACFLLFAAAAHRFMAPDALIGVHSASENGEESLATMGFTTALARDVAAYGVPPAIIGKMVQTEPGRMAWLTPSDLQPMGVVILTPFSTQERPLAPAPPQTAPVAQQVFDPSGNWLGNARPGERLALVMPVLGAPADGYGSLAFALKKCLAAMGIGLARGPGENVYTIRGRASLGEAGWRTSTIRIDWQVFDPGGNRLGTVSQQNTIPNSLADGRVAAWGDTADAAAIAAVDSVIKLFAPSP